MKKYLNRVLCALLAFCVTFSCAAATVVDYGAEVNPEEKTYSQTLSDVPTTHWAFKFIAELVERKAVNGYPDGRFRPELTVSRQEFAKIMVAAAGLNAAPAKASSFSDVPLTHWASPFVEVAKPFMTAYQGAGGQLLFKPSDGALREDIAVAVVKLKGYDTRLADISMIEAMFSDVDAISAVAKPYVALAVENEIISGYPNGTFGGQNTITRGEAAAILWRAFEYGSDSKVVIDDATTLPPVPPTPTQPEKPEQPPVASEKKYQVDTVAEGLTSLHSMIITNDNTVFYIDGDTVYNSQDTTTINLNNDLKYALDVDDKNRTFGILSYKCLAYDSYNDKVYLLGNDPGDCMVIYDITNPASPTMLVSRDNSAPSFTLSMNWTSMPEHAKVLPNGVLILPSDSGGSNMVNVTSRAITEVNHLYDGYLVGSKLVEKGSGATMIVRDPMTGTKTVVSVEGEFPDVNASSIFASKDKLYFWDKSTGLRAIDLDGWSHEMIPVNQIDTIDFKPLPDNVWDLVISRSGACAIYDNTQKAIRLLSEK